MSDDPLAGLIGSVRRQRKDEDGLDFSRTQKPQGEKGLNPLDLLGLPPAQRDLVNFLSRKKQATLSEIAENLQTQPDKAEKTINDLVESGYLRATIEEGRLFYRVVFGGKISRSGRGVPQLIWDAVDLDNTVFLRQLSLFHSLSDEALKEVASKVTSQRYNRNEVIIWQGHISENIYFIKNGIVGISRLTPESTHQESEILAYLKQGDIFAEHNLLEEHQYPASATATALSEVEVLVITRQDMLDLLLRFDNIAIELARLLADRLIAINNRLSTKGGEIKLSLVFGIKNMGITTIGSTLALTLAKLTKRKAVYTEHPDPKGLLKLFNLQANGEIHRHMAGFDIAVIEGAVGLPSTVRTTLVMDRLLNDYSNIVIGLHDEIDENLTYMLEKANQVVIVTAPDAEAWNNANTLVGKIRANIHPERTSIVIVANHAQPNLPSVGHADFEIPFLATLPTLEHFSEDNLPEILQEIGQHLADRLGRTNQLGIYIPSTVDVDQAVDTSGYIQSTMTFLGELFGGALATSSEAHGVWNSEEVGLVSESIHIVRTFVTQTELDRYLGDVLEYVEQLKSELKQEAMALEVNQKLMII